MATGRRELKVVIVGDDQSGTRAIANFEARLGKMQGAVAGISAAVTHRLLQVAETAGRSVYRVGADYQDSLNTFQAVSQASASQMHAVRDAAKALGADLRLPKTSAADAAVAMSALARGGLSVEDAMGAARGSLQLATAAQTSEAEAATITARALRAFRLEGGQATRVADLLAAAANASTVEISDVAASLSQASSVFARAGFPIEQVTTAIAQLGNAGIVGSDAGTSLRSMLLHLQGPTAKARELMSALGISVYQANGSMKTFPDLIETFTGRLRHLSPAARDAALATIFGADAVRAANEVLLQGGGVFDRNYQAVTRQGAAADVAAAKTKGLRGAVSGLVSQLETQAITAFDRAGAGAERFVRSITGRVPTFFGDLGVQVERVLPRLRDLFDDIRTAGQNLAPTVGAVAAIFGGAFLVGLGGAADLLATVSGFVRDNQALFVTLAVALGAGTVAFKTITVAAKAYAAVQGLVNAVLAANPIVIAVVALAALAAGLVVAWKRSETFRKVVVGAIQFVADKFLAAAEWILKGAVNAFGWIPGVGDKLRAAARTVEAFRDNVNASLDSLHNRVVDIKIRIKPIAEAVTMLPNGRIRESGPPVAQQAAQAAQTAAQSFTSAFTAAGTGGGGGGAEASTALRDFARRAIEGLHEGLRGGRGKLLAQVRELRDIIQRAFEDKDISGSARNAAMAILDKNVAALSALADRRSAVVRKLEAAEKRLADLRRARAEFTASVRDSARAFAAATTIQAAEGKLLSSSDVLGGLRDRLAKVAEFSRQVALLRRRGLNAATLRDILQAGVEGGGQTAAALAGASDAELREVNNLQAKIGSATDALGQFAGSAMYAAGEAAAAGLVRGLQAKKKELEDAARKMAQILGDAIRKALGIASPSRVTFGLGEMTGAGMAAGMDAKRAEVEAAAGRMADAALPTVAPPAGLDAALPAVVPRPAGSGHGYGGQTTIVVQVPPGLPITPTPSQLRQLVLMLRDELLRVQSAGGRSPVLSPAGGR